MRRTRMICLGIECTAHTFGIGIIKDKKILANIKDSYITEQGGIIPIDAAKHHEAVKNEELEKDLEKANLELKDVDVFSFSNAPGLAPCLLTGMAFAKKLAAENKKPLIPVNHCCAHLEIGKLLTKAKDPVLLYASGANTQIMAFEGGKYRIFGETLDQGIGNFLDAFARYIGLGFPGGPKIYELSLKAKNFVELPYVVKGMDVSFSGILSNLKQKYDSKEYSVEDLSFSAQETTFAMLIEVSERAMAHCNKNELLLGGGVGCNIRLQEMGRKMCESRNAKSFAPENQFLVDNGAMIANLGLLMAKAGYKKDSKRIDIQPYQRTDDIEVIW